MNRRALEPDRRTLLLGAAATACAPAAPSAPPAPFPMRRGVNLGNTLEAPNEGDWGYRIDDAHLRRIAQSQFDGIRLPVRWDTHMDGVGRIDPAFLARVHEVASRAIDLDLMVQLDVHHYAALIEDPAAETERFLSLWRQLGESFAPAPRTLLFELLNEPNGPAWDGDQLTDLQRAAIEVVRESNPERLIVLGPGNWQNIDALRDWRPPAGENIAVSVHYYEPHAFTHQNAPWLGDEAPVFGREWGTRADHDVVRAHIRQAAHWGAAHGYAMQLGEFGVNVRVPGSQRGAWTRAVREACDENGMAWCVWDLAGAFAILSLHENALLHDMALALFD